MAAYVCISIMDESSPATTVHFSDWSEFRANYPTRVFWLLQPAINTNGTLAYQTSALNVPQNYIDEYTVGSAGYTGLTHPVIQVNRDGGNQTYISDWFDICQLNTLASGSVISVALDTSGSMTLATVQASYDYFKTRCANAGIEIVWDLRFSDERWIPPHNKGLPPTAVFTSSTPDLTLGQSATLTWTVTGDVSTVEIVPGIGTVGITGSQTVTPTVTTTYTLTATAPDGSTSIRSVKITVYGPDSEPDLFGFSNITGATTSTSYDSETVIISGLGAGVSVNVTATNGAQTSVNGGAFSTTSKTIANDGTLAVRMTSSSLSDTKKTTTISVGAVDTTWSITTTSSGSQIPNPFSFTDVTNASLLTYAYSDIVTITGLGTSTTVSSLISGSGFQSSVNGGAWSSASKTITNGQTLQLRLLTSDVLGETKTTSVTVGQGAARTWSVTNVTTADSSPDYFEFTDITNAALSTVTASAAVTITGINVPTTVTTTNSAAISVNGGTYGSSPKTINNNDTVSVRLTSSSTPGGSVSTTVTIGSLSDTWTVTSTTAGDTTPDSFFFYDQENQPPSTLIESNTVIISGLTSPATVTVTTGAQFSINNGSWVTSGTISTGDTLKVRRTSSATLGGSVSTNVTVGSYTTTWRIYTYSSADNLDPSVWYSRKGKKEDGLAIGTVISIFRDRSGNWGTLDGSSTSRYHGWIECDGRSLNASDYPDLFDSIGNTYGGTASRTLSGNSYTYSGTFKLPNYRNRKLFGLGRVDGNSAASPIVTTYKAPDPSSVTSGDGNVVGSTGGNWYIAKYDASGTPPDEQVYQGTEPPDGKFYKLGTISTTGAEEITGEIGFNIVGNTSATIGPITDVVVINAQHEHDIITAQVDAIDVGCVAWGTPGFYQISTGEIGAATYSKIGYNTVVSPGGEFNASFNNYWAGGVQNNVSGLPGGGNHSAALDVNNVSGNVSVYSPGELKTHSHYLALAAFGSPGNVYGWGNNNGGGTAAGGMATTNTVTVNFSQTELALSANEAKFTLNPTKKVLPTPSLVPENTIPLLTKYYRVKYIIKAF